MLADLVDDVDAYLIAWLNREAQRLSEKVLRGMPFSPVDIPLP